MNLVLSTICISFILLLNIFSSVSFSSNIELEQIPNDSYKDYTTSSDWDNGTKINTTTSTDRYNQTANTLELDFPYASKDPDLISYWRMENLTDEKGTHNLINSGSADVNTNGKFDSCYNFNDGDSEYMTITDTGNDYDFAENESFTVMIWAKIVNTGVGQRILSKYTGADYGWELRCESTGKLRFGIKSTGSYRYAETTNVYWGDSTFHLIILRRGEDSNTINLRVDDGVADDKYVLGYNGTLATNLDLYIGRYAPSPTAYFDGDLDELKIYDTALSNATLLNMYNSGNRYKSSGNWTSPYINLTGTNEKLNNITYDLDFADGNNCIDNTTIIYSDNSTVIGWDDTDITTSDSLIWSDFTPSNTFNLTLCQNISIQTFLKGDNSDTPTISLINYTTVHVPDTIAPEISNVTAVPDPGEAGFYVNITANITDTIAVYGAWLNVTYPNSTTSNYTMVQGLGLEWLYNTSYSALGTHSFIIWANDTSGNSNSSGTGFFNITDTTAPEISNVTAVPDPGETGFYVNLSADIDDFVAVYGAWVNVTYVNSSYSNNSMIKGSGSEWYFNTSYTDEGQLNYTIWSNDTSDNWNNSGLYFFNVTDTIAPGIANVTAVPDPGEAGSYVNITADITDTTAVYGAWVNVTNPDSTYSNNSMFQGSGSEWHYNSTYLALGQYNYTIWTNDSSNNWNFTNGSFSISLHIETLLLGGSPIDEFFIDFLYKVVGHTVIFLYVGDDTENLVWSFGDGSGRPDDGTYRAVHNYPNNDLKPITYEVSIYVLDGNGEWHKRTKEVTLGILVIDLEDNILQIPYFTINLWLSIAGGMVTITTNSYLYDPKKGMSKRNQFHFMAIILALLWIMFALFIIVS